MIKPEAVVLIVLWLRGLVIAPIMILVDVIQGRRQTREAIARQKEGPA